MSYTVVATAVSGILDRKSFCCHRDGFFDVEEHPGGGFALIFRSSDKAIVGKTDTPANAEFLFNDAAGARIPIVLAEAPAGPGFAPPRILVDAAAELVAFYRSDASFTDRLAKLGQCARDVLPLVMALIGPKQRRFFKVGHFQTVNAKAAEKRSRDIEVAAKVLNNADALAAALEKVAGRTGAPLSPEFLARVQQVWAMVGSAA